IKFIGMTNTFKTLEFIYQDMQIHFLINPTDNNVMINATEMAKAFDKRIDVFLKADHTKNFIKELENFYSLFPPNGGNKNDNAPDISGTLNVKIIETKKKLGTYMCEPLAL